jgi:hypothetical protein
MSADGTTWLIIEPTFSGHHYTYLLEICRGAVARGIEVIVAVGNDAAGDQIGSKLRAALPDGRIRVLRIQLPRGGWFGGAIGLLHGEIEWWRFFKRALEAARAQAPIDFVFVPYLDRALFAVSILGSPFGTTPFGGITLRQRFHLREAGVTSGGGNAHSLRRALFLRLLRTKSLRVLHVIDDTLEAYVRKRYPALAEKVRFIPDPIVPVDAVDAADARRALLLPAGAPLILVYGYIDVRKGVARLLRWLADSAGESKAHVLIAGALTEDMESLFSGSAARELRSQDRLWVMDRYIDPRDEPLVFCAADYVWLGYENVELMSGVMIKAAQFHKAVLFDDYGLIGWYAKRFGMERAADDGAPQLAKPPEGIEVRFFPAERPTSDRLPDHSWENACNSIFTQPRTAVYVPG